MRRFRLTSALTAACLTAAGLATACLTSERSAVSATAQRAFALPASGEWQNGDETITFTTAQRDTVTEVTEQVTFGSDGTARRLIEFGPQGALLAFRETRRQTAQASDRSPTRMEVEVALTFAGDSVTSRTKRVDGAEAPIRDFEIAAVRAHSAELIDRFAGSRQPPSPRITP